MYSESIPVYFLCLPTKFFVQSPSSEGEEHTKLYLVRERHGSWDSDFEEAEGSHLPCPIEVRVLRIHSS